MPARARQNSQWIRDPSVARLGWYGRRRQEVGSPAMHGCACLNVLFAPRTLPRSGIQRRQGTMSARDSSGSHVGLPSTPHPARRRQFLRLGPWDEGRRPFAVWVRGARTGRGRYWLVEHSAGIRGWSRGYSGMPEAQVLSATGQYTRLCRRCSAVPRDRLTYNFHAAVFGRHRHFGGSLHRSRLNSNMVSLCRSVIGGRTGVCTHNPQTSVQFCGIRGESCCSCWSYCCFVRLWPGLVREQNAPFRPLRILRVGHTGRHLFVFGSGCETASRFGRTCSRWIAKRWRGWVSAHVRRDIFLWIPACGALTETRSGRQANAAVEVAAGTHREW